MGLIGSLFGLIFNIVETSITQKKDEYDSGYTRGTSRASQMSDEELRSSMQRIRQSKNLDMNRSGQYRAMEDEYNRRK